MRTLSLRTRLTLWYMVTLVVVLVVFGADVLAVQRRLGVANIDREIDNVHGTLTNILSEEFEEKDSPRVAATEACVSIDSAGGAIAIFDTTGTLLGANLGQLALADASGAATALPAAATVQTTGGEWRVHAERRTFDANTLTLVVGRSMADLEREQRELRQAMFVGMPVVLLLAGLGGSWLAAIGLRPITVMARRAASVPLTGMEDLGAPSRDDELGQLAHAFNGLVARLRAALQTQRQFMADASHELRTPVSVVRTASEVTLSLEHRSETEYREALTIAGAQARRLGRLVEDMLVLARADGGAYPLRLVDLYLSELVDECRQAVAVIASERRIAVDATGSADVTVRGDEELLRRLLLNILQNAVQHSPAGSTVVVDLRADRAQASVRVTDTGPGIPEADRERIFDRFVQLDPSRRAEGTGLGLTIAKWIAEAHHGSLVVETSGPGGSTFRVDLPVSPA